MDVDIASARYRKLIGALGREMKERYGWKSAAARKLGVSPTYLQKVIDGEIHIVGEGVIRRAMESMKLHEDFFTDPDVEPDDYRRFQLTASVAPRMKTTEARGTWEVAVLIADMVLAGDDESAKKAGEALSTLVLVSSEVQAAQRMRDAPSADAARHLAAEIQATFGPAKTMPAENEESSNSRLTHGKVRAE